MITNPTLVVVGRDDLRVGAVLRELSRLNRVALRHVEDIEDVWSIVKAGEPTVLIVAPESTDEAPAIAGLIACLAVERGVVCPVVVMSPVYDQDEALMYFRVGATDYLGLDTHLDRVAAVVSSLLGANEPLSSESARKPARPAKAGQVRRASPIA